MLVQDITIEGKGKAKDFEDFIEKMHELDRVMEMGESFTRFTYAQMLLREELALFFLYVLFNIATLIFFERLPKLLSERT